jgi:WD40 repeat protein/tRNA A-37 threonylcarbamoyl transferase component Bud32
MPAATQCPDAPVLRQFALGLMAPAEVEPLAVHVERCEHCTRTLEGLKGQDTLVEAMSAQGTIEEEPPAIVNTLIERLKAVSPADAPSGEHTLPNQAEGPPAQPEPEIKIAALPASVAKPAAGPAPEATQEFLTFLAPPQGPGELGRLGGYRVLKVLGTGGMGLVFHAEDVRLKRAVALKVMRPELTSKPDFNSRFQREAQAAAAVKHDNIATVYQVGEDREISFLAMELLEGESLADRLHLEQKLPVAEVLRIGHQVARGLAAAHARGLIHRDIKPANLWLEGEPGASATGGRVKILDFGLAKLGGGEAQATQSGRVMGTPSYMAPEQARGETVDARADLFSLGCVLYRAATGQMPFKGDETLSVLWSLATEKPRSAQAINPELPAALSDLIDGLLAKDAASRPTSARAVVEALEAISRQQAVAAHTRTPRRRLVVAVAAGLAAAAAVIGLIVVIIRDQQGREVARIEVKVPEGGSVEVKDVRKDKDDGKKPPAPKLEVPIKPIALAPLIPNEPLSPSALVQQPARLPGVRSWTIASRNVWNPTAIAYPLDGRHLAVGSEDGSIRIWEPHSGRLVQVLLRKIGVASLAWHPNSRLLAVGLSRPGRQVQFGDAFEGHGWRTYDVPVDFDIRALAWSPDGKTLLAACDGLHLFAWDTDNGQLVRDVRLNVPAATPIAFSPDAKRLAAVGQDASGVLVLDAETGKELRKLAEGKGFVPSGAWSPDGKHYACAAADGVHVWNAETGQETFHYKDGSDGAHLCWSPDGRALAISRGHGWGTVVVEVGKDGKRWETDAGDSLVAWSPDGKTVARAYIKFEGQHDAWAVRLYDAATGKQQRSLCEATAVTGFAWSPNGQTVAVMSDRARQGEHQLALLSADTGGVLAMLKGATGAFAWSPDGKALATGAPHGNNGVLVWDTAGKIRHTLVGDVGGLLSVAWSPDGKRLASTGAGEKRVLLWNADNGSRIRELGPFDQPTDRLTWLPNGWLGVHVTNAGAGSWHFWDVAQNRLVNDPKQWGVPFLHFTPDGRSALLRPDFNYRLRDLATGKDRSGPLLSGTWDDPPIAWSPDGKLVARGAGATVELWRIFRNRRIRILRGPSAPELQQVAFSPDGKLLAARAGERLYFWEVETGRLRGVLMLGVHNNGLTIAPDGHYTGNEQVERGIVMVVQKDDGTQEVLEPADFEQKYGFKNEPDKVHLLQPLPPPLYPSPGQPIGPHALVREPAELSDPNVTSWTIETRSTREHARALAYRPDSKLLATGGGDGTIRLWDPATGDLVRMLLGHPVLSLSWSPDGRVVAAGSEDTTRLWEAETGRLLRRIPVGRIVAWSPAGSVLAQLSGQELSLWDATKEQYLRKIQFAGQGQALVWSPDGKTIAVGLDDKTARLWDVASWKERQKLEGHDGTHVRGIAWSPDSKRLVTVAQGGGGRSFCVWDAATGKLQHQFALEAPVDLMMFPTVAWSPDGKAVVLGRNGGFFGLCNPDSGARIRALDAGGDVFALAWSPDGKQVATATLQGVRLYDASTAKQTHALEEGNRQRWRISLALAPDAQRLALGFTTGALLAIVETATGRRAPTPAEAGGVAAWAPNGKLLAATASDSTVRLWDAATAQPVRTLEGQVIFGVPFLIAWSADGKMVAAGGSQRLSVWSAESGKLLWKHDVHQNVYGIVWSPDGSRLATTDDGDKGEVRVWESQTGKLLHAHPWRSPALAWSPDGKTLAAAPAAGNHCHLIDAATGAVRVRGKDEPGGGVMAIRWSPDGRTFDTLYGSGPTLVFDGWDAANGKQLRSIPIAWPPTFPYISQSAWSRDGRVLAMTTGCQVNLFYSEGHPRGVLLPTDPFAHLAITADGHYRGTTRVERQIRMVVQKRDGTSETLTPAEFEQRYGWHNEPAKVRLVE